MSSFRIETMVFHNPTEHTIRLDAIGLDPVPPNGEVEIPISLAAPTRTDNNQRGKSPLEQVAPQLEPKDPADRADWLKIPPHASPQSRVVSVTARPASEAPGVKALRESREAKAASEAQKATASLKPNDSAKAGKA